MIKKTFDASLYSRKAYTAGQSSTAADGGETVPSPLADYYMELLRDNSVIRPLTRTFAMKSKTLDIPRHLTGMSMYVLGEGKSAITESGSAGTGDATTKSTFDKITMTNEKLVVLGGWTTELAEDSFIDVGQFVTEQGAIAMAEGEEYAWIWGDSTGAFATYGNGQPEKVFDGIIHQVPSPNNTAVSSKWTPVNTGYDNIVAGGQDLLTLNEFNDMLSRVEDVAGNGKIDIVLAPPKVVARLRDPMEFEAFATADKVSGQGSNQKGFVGEMYGVKILSSGFLPTGSKTAPTTGTNIVTSSTDTVVLGFNSKTYAAIGQRRGIEIKQQHDFYRDIEELRFLERVAFEVLRPEHTAMIHNVKNAAV